MAPGGLLLLVFAHGCGTPFLQSDAERNSDDASDTHLDVRASDSTSPPLGMDSGSPVHPVDGGAPPGDDGSTVPEDSGTVTPPPAHDAGSVTPPPEHDAGSVTPPPGHDAGSPPPVVDAGTPPPPTTGPTVGGCEIFPADNPWNRDISADPVDPRSASIIANIQSNAGSSSEHYLHPDFGSNPSYGIPYVVVPASQASVPITFNEYPSESDPGPYPVPSSATIEGGNDHHVLVVQQGSCHLFEMYHSARSGSGWTAGSGATWDLSSNALRPAGWTSCDQAGLPILPGLTRYDEVTAGAIHHALRFTLNVPQDTWVSPARHPGSSSDASAPPMGARLRLRADFDLTPYHGESLVILRALKQYGMYVADTGPNWFVSGATDSRWDDTDLGQLRNVPGSAFEVVQLGTIEHY